MHEDASGGVIDNESLEFLGDSVLGFIIADLLFRDLPEHNEGQKSKLKASLVSAASLARLGDRLGLGEFLILGRGEEKTGGRQKLALIADGYEALIAADLSRWRRRAGPRLPGTAVRRADRRGAPDRRGGDFTEDYKSALQEWLQAHGRGLPVYRLVAESGPPHRRTFEVEVLVGGEGVARADGRSKKEAAQAAAKLALDALTDALTQSDGQTFPHRAPCAAGRAQSISMIPQFFSRAPAPPVHPPGRAPARCRAAAP